MPHFQDAAAVPGATDILVTAARLVITQRVVAEMVAVGGGRVFPAVEQLLAALADMPGEGTSNDVARAAAREMQEIIKHAVNR